MDKIAMEEKREEADPHEQALAKRSCKLDKREPALYASLINHVSLSFILDHLQWLQHGQQMVHHRFQHRGCIHHENYVMLVVKIFSRLPKDHLAS